VRHGWGYSQFSSSWKDLASEVIFFVPVADPVRVVRWQLTNQGSVARPVALFAYNHLVLGTLPPAPGSLSVRGERDLAALTCGYPDSSPFRERRVFASVAIDGAKPGNWSFTGDRAGFLGIDGGGMRQPAALRSRGVLGGEGAQGADACFAQQILLDLAPGATVEVAFLLGEYEPQGELSLETLLGRFRKAGAIDAMLEAVREVWKATVGGIRIQTPVPALDLMVNGWMAYQAISSRIVSRTAYYQSGGAYGFRDQLQDTHGLSLLWPALTREQILRHARHQFTGGDVMHWWHPEPIGRGLRTRFSDDLIWLPYVASAYVRLTGDVSIWSESVPFLTAPPLAEGQDETYLEAVDSGQTGTLYDHCCRSIDRSLAVGSHGLPLMGCGDWNDGMNRVGRLGRGESVWMAFFLGDTLKAFIPWCEYRGNTVRVKHYTKCLRALGDAVDRGAWDGDWYRRAYYDNGTPLGTASASECRIDNLAQSWAVISGLANPDRAKRAVESAWEELVDRESGVVRLLAPSFVDAEEDPGYIKGYVAGVRENGGQEHACRLLVRQSACAVGTERGCRASAGMADAGLAYPEPEETDRYMVEPYVIAADIYHGAPHTGRGGWTWYTGSAAWFYRVVVETLLGFSISGGDEALLRPRVPATWPGFQLRYRHGKQGTVYDIKASREEGNGNSLDGEPLKTVDGAVRLPLVDDGVTHAVTIRLG